MSQAFETQAEPGQRVNLAGEQSITGQAELDEVVQHSLREAGAFAVFAQALIHQQAIGFADVADHQLPAFMVTDGIAGAETHAG